MEKDVLKELEQNRIIAIMRHVSLDKVVPVAKALYDGGIRLLEITFQQGEDHCEEETAQAILKVKSALGEKMLVGAGTVMTPDQAKPAKNAGASFLLSPNVDIRVIEEAKKLGLVMIPGAFTPSEIAAAYQAGADVIKVFPAENLGLGYFKSVMAPMGHIPMIAVGGIDEKNLKDFLSIGLKGVGIGSNIVKRQLVEKEDYAGLTALSRMYTSQLI